MDQTLINKVDDSSTIYKELVKDIQEKKKINKYKKMHAGWL